jgi:hypothetical protein
MPASSVGAVGALKGGMHAPSCPRFESRVLDRCYDVPPVLYGDGGHDNGRPVCSRVICWVIAHQPESELPVGAIKGCARNDPS